MIFCVEDDESIRELVIYTLQTTGFDACGFCDGEGLMERLKTEKPELILLDIMLPGEDGIQILKKIRAGYNTKNIPVILLTAKNTEFDKVTGLDNGADDYIAKPFGMMELISRVKAVLRRSSGNITTSSELKIGNVSIDTEKHQVFANGEEVMLTYKEFELLRYLFENKTVVITRDRLLDQVWGYEYGGETRTVDVHVRTLRQKLGESGNIIETVRGVGYRVGGGL